MKRIPPSMLTAVLALGIVLGVSIAWAHPVDRPGQKAQPTQPAPPGENSTSLRADTGGGGALVPGMNEMTYETRLAQVDSTMQQMTRLMETSRTLSKSFAQLAELHHGADKGEIQMMQRVSDSMGVMAGEIKTTLLQYSKMLQDETASESGGMRGDVDNLHGAMATMARQISDAIQTLQRLDIQLGQG